MYDLAINRFMHLFKSSWESSALGIITSLMDILLLIGLVSSVFYMLRAKDAIAFVRERRSFLVLIASLILSGILLARAFGFVENIYQVAFASYIVASLLIFILFMFMANRSWKVQVALIVVCLSTYAASRIHEGRRAFIFTQNGKQPYSGVEYSKGYISQVTAFAANQRMCIGGFIADSSYYAKLIYTQRNPNIYHLPITYILANHATINDFGLSDPAAIKYDREGYFKHNFYLDNAIARSYYHRSYKSYAVTDTTTLKNIGNFLRENHLQYLILTPGVVIDSVPGIAFRKKLTDPNTKERFWIIEQ
jgi:hypothetical protein